MIAIHLSKKQKLDADTKKSPQKSVLPRNLERVGNAAMFFIIEEVKETVLDFLQGTVKVL